MCRFFVGLVLLLSLTANWVQADNLETAIMPGQVIQGHAKYEEKCDSCHKRFEKSAQNKLCMDCHKDVGKDVLEKQGFHGKQNPDKDCRQCHTEHKGRNGKLINLDEKAFKHQDTDFQLKGKHAEDKVKCADCHKPKMKWREAPHTCVDCHKKDDDKAHHGNLGRDCLKCHTEKDWKVPDFDHSKTDFALKGKHVDVKCTECHIEGKYKDTPKECFECHRKDDDKAHKRVFGNKCETCHAEKSWKEDIHFDHNRDTKFDLLDKHRETKCSSCHRVAGDRLKSSCVSCHKKDDKHNGTLGDKCEDCHNAKDWKSPKGFDHDKDTKFLLRDKHKEAKCDKCHTSSDHKYEKLPMDCWSCHKKDDEKAHKGNYGRKCESCHKENDWKKIFFNHDKDTKYMLKFKHFEVKCDKCHTGKLYEQKLSQVCYDCHKKTDDDKGHKGNLGDKCDKCHTEKSWKDTVFNHDKDTKYPLLFKHKETKCNQCHTSQVYRDKTPSDCYACHKKDDKHNGQEGKKCEDCHSVKGWKAEVKFDHNKTKFPLVGKHFSVECKKCHETAEFKVAKTDCYSCHKKEDKHELRLGKKCDSCHNARDWKTWDFDHDQRTKYKIDGAHKKIGCYDCHRLPANGDRFNTPTSCVGCHDNDDIHEGGFGKQCERCHVTSSFKVVKPKIAN